MKSSGTKDLGSLGALPHDRPATGHFPRFFSKAFNCGIAGVKLHFSMLLHILPKSLLIPSRRLSVFQAAKHHFEASEAEI